MGEQPDPWSGGGDRTRAEVRDIFARHAERGAGAAAEERHRPLPGFLGLPLRIWRVLSPAGRMALGVLLVACAALLALLLPPAFENASQNRVNERRAAAANLEEIRRTLVADQRPRRATLPLPVRPAELETVVGADYARRVRAGDLDGPVGETACRPVDSEQARGSTVFTCLAARGETGGKYGDRALVTGYRFRARVVLASGAATWCKENPRPLHADQEEFVVVALSRACTG